MKRFAIAAGCALALAGCRPAISNDIQNLEKDIRETAEQRGLTLKQIGLRAESNDRIVGTATVAPRANPAMETHWDCSARRTSATGFQWNCAPPGRAAPAGSGSAAAPAPPPAASAPAPAAADRAVLAGRWTDVGDCSNALELSEDGIFIAADGGRGNWDIQGSQLTLSGPGGSLSFTVLLNDPDTMTVTAPDGSQTQSTRC